MSKTLWRGVCAALFLASLAHAQNPVYANFDLYGYFNATVSPYTAPFALVTTDPTGATCPDLTGEFVFNTANNHLSGCGASGWAVISGTGGGVTGPVSSTDYALAAFNGTGGNTLRNTTVLTDGSGDLTIPGTVTIGSSGAGTINTHSGIVQSGTASNSDGVGELSLSSATTATYTWTLSYTSHPEVTLTCQFDCHGNSPWVTYTGTTSFTINFATAVTGTVTYSAQGRN